MDDQMRIFLKGNISYRYYCANDECACADTQKTQICFTSVLVMREYTSFRHSFYPTALKGCRGIVFTHGVWMGGQREKFVRSISRKP